jgi:hypothetical protein
MAELINITPVDPISFAVETYSPSDESLLSINFTPTTFTPDSNDYIEFYIFDTNNSILLSELNYREYSILDNELYVDPNNDVVNTGYDEGVVNVLYNFYTYILNSSPFTTYYIKEISANRTELRLATTALSALEVSSSVTDFITSSSLQPTFQDFYLNLGNNYTLIANNILLDTTGGETTVLVKLYEPLPSNIGLKQQLWLVSKLSDSLAYQLEYVSQIIPTPIGEPISGPNFNLPVKGELNNSTDYSNLANYTSASVSQSQYQVNSYFNKPGVEINVDYSEYSSFVNFSSAYARVENFFYKVELIETLNAEVATLQTTSATGSLNSNITTLNNLINETITNFDGYEYYLYFESGSNTYPKTNTEAPFNNYSYSSSEAQTWVTASLATAADYDEFNNNYLKFAIPEFIRDDAQNESYMTFINMVGQFFDDNVWVYIKDITNKYDADNRIDFGVSKDLVAQILRDFGVKLYQNNYSDFDLYSAFIGTTASGSLFPFPYMTGSLPTPTGYEYVNTAISSSNAAVPIDDINKRIYKRLYNNLPYLLKKKGTVAGLRALIDVYGIPDTILRISEFGGKDRINSNDWDLWYDQFDYMFATGDSGNVETPWLLNSSWPSENNVPQTIEFRFKTPGLASAIAEPSQSLWRTDADTFLVLEYTGSGYTSGSWSGSSVDPYNEYATLKLISSGDSASVYLPFFDGGWWSVAATREGNNFNLYAANNIYDGWDGSTIGFQASSSLNSSAGASEWSNGTTSHFPSGSNTYTPFSGSYQEIRYYSVALSQSVFDDFVMNPQSMEGNSTNSAPDQLAFRAALGGELYTGSVSIHPKVTGSWTPVPSFASDSDFVITGGGFDNNRGTIFYDSPPVGIKNRNTDKIKRYETILAPSTYGVNYTQVLPDSDVLSSQISVQQSSFISESYTNNLNYLEVAFSPQNEINDDIISSIGYFEVGDYIGDPRLIPTRNVEYPDLVALRDAYFLKYIKNYDLTDFVRLIKFFDNSLFKMIKDYVPARTSIATGIVVKQHILERQKYPLPQATIETPQGAYSSSAGLLTPILFQDLTLTGSIGQRPALLDGQRIYLASSDFESFPLEHVTGSQGGTLPDLTVDFAEDFGFTTNQIVNVTQSWSGYNLTPFEPIPFTDSTAQEYVNGEFSGSTIVATNGELNPECDPYKVASTTVISYNVSSSFIPTFQGFVNQQQLVQGPGEIHIWWQQTIVNQEREYAPGYFDYIWSPAAFTISKESANGIDLDDYIPSVLNYIFQTGYTSGDVTLSGWTPSYIPSYNLGNLELEVINIQEYSDAISFSGTGYYLIQLAPNSYNIAVLTDNPAGTVAIANKSNVLSVLSPFVPLSFGSSDCNPVYGNEIPARVNPDFMDVDYSGNAIAAVNQQAIINGDATPSTVQTYNYHARRSVYPRYIGSRNSDIEVTDDPGYYYGTLNPNIDSPFYPAQDRSSLILEFNGGGGTYPEIEKGGAVFVTQLINATGPDNVTYFKQKDQGYTDMLNFNYRGYDFENYVIVNQYEGSTATMPPSASQIILTDASIPATSSYFVPNSTQYQTGAITFTDSNKYIQWVVTTSGTPRISTVALDPNGYETTGSAVSTSFFLATVRDSINQGGEWYISLYSNLQTTASGSLGQILNWPIRIVAATVGVSYRTYLDAGIKNDEFIAAINGYTVGAGQYGALIWQANQSIRAVAVQAPEISNFSGIQKGALSKPNNTVMVQQNLEYFTRRFGSDVNPNVPLFQTEPAPQSPPK